LNAELASFDKLRMSAHGEPVEPLMVSLSNHAGSAVCALYVISSQVLQASVAFRRMEREPFRRAKETICA